MTWIVSILFLAGLSGSVMELRELHDAIETIAAKRFASAGDTQRLGQLVDQLEARFPKEPATFYWRAVLLDREQQTQEAAGLLKSCLDRAGEADAATTRRVHGEAAAMLAAIRLAERNADQAKRLAQRAIAEQPDVASGYRILVEASFADGTLSQTKEILRDAADAYGEQNPELVELYLSVLRRLGEWSALDAYVAGRLKDDPVSAVAHHYRGRLLEQEGKFEEAGWHHAVAALNGSPESESTLLSQERVSRLGATEHEPGDSPPASIGSAFDLVSRCEARLVHGMEADDEERARAKDMLGELSQQGAKISPLLEHFQATLDFAEGNLAEAKAKWEAIMARWPRFVPALSRLAQVLEVEPDRASQEQAEAYWQRSRELCPRHPLVRERDQLGLRLRVEKDGVVVEAVEADSPLSEAGLKAGQRIVGIDRKRLGPLSATERLRRVRQFSGGALVVATEDGTEQTISVDLFLHE